MVGKKNSKRWIAVAVIGSLLLLVTGRVEAQCTGYSITSTNVNVLSPTKAAAQGWTTGTIRIQSNGVDSNGNPGSFSHNLTQTTGTGYTVSWRGLNFPSGAYATFTVPQANTSWGVTLSTSWVNWSVGNSNPGPETFVFTIYDSSGHVLTTDRVTVTGTSGVAGLIVKQDNVPTNAYYQHVTYFGGGSMMNNCRECQGGETQPCLLATHTPSFDATMTNPATGETQTLSNISAGNIAKAQESVSGSSSIMISVLPGDSPSGTTTDKIYCTMFGWVMSQQWNPGLPQNEFAITELETIPSTCALALRFFETGDSWGVQCQVAWKKPPATNDRCSAASQIPDFNPATVWDEQDCKVPGNCNTSDLPPPNGTSTSFPKYWYGASWGIRFGGPPAPGQPDPIINGGAHNWVFPIYLADAYIPGGPDEQWWILDLLNIAVAKGTGLPIDCTYKDHGTSPIQSPW